MNSEKLVRCINIWLKDTSKWLDISRCGLTKWPVALAEKESLIVKLNCNNNRLSFLPVLPNLYFLDCRNNQLTSLPGLPDLLRLYCSYNQLTSLLVYPKLAFLSCYNNQLTSLPKYLNLTALYCRNNRLISLSVLHNLIHLHCSENQLTFGSLKKWKKIWHLQSLRKSELRKRGLGKVLRIMRLRLYLPRLSELEEELVYSPNHPGKFYKSLRVGDWSFECEHPAIKWSKQQAIK